MSRPRLAVIQFPGSNCESETIRMADASGFETSLMRWNSNSSELASFDAYILPGGFSYQDRVRSGVIASRLPLMEVLLQADQLGKPILGICNGCQILAESGLVPNLSDDFSIQMGLAKNTYSDEAFGFLCEWVYVSFLNPEKNMFTRGFSKEDVLAIPVNHGEGHFCLSELAVNSFQELSQIYYCDVQGNRKESYPVNPNGSFANLAGLSNKKGNVLAMMPHPERAFFLRQLPLFLGGAFADEKRKHFSSEKLDQIGLWGPLLQSCYQTLEGN